MGFWLFWLVLVGFGWFWLVLVGFGWFWLFLALGSLCSVVKTLIVSGNRQRDRPTKGQGHLLSCSGQLKNENILTYFVTYRSKKNSFSRSYVCIQTKLTFVKKFRNLSVRSNFHH